jgi:hypothetical protein
MDDATSALAIRTAVPEKGPGCVVELHLDGSHRGQLCIYRENSRYRSLTAMTRDEALLLARTLIKIWGEEPHPRG